MRRRDKESAVRFQTKHDGLSRFKNNSLVPKFASQTVSEIASAFHITDGNIVFFQTNGIIAADGAAISLKIFFFEKTLLPSKRALEETAVKTRSFFHRESFETTPPCLFSSNLRKISLSVSRRGGFAFLRGIKKKTDFYPSFHFGRSERIRTSDPLHPIQVRYQTAPRSVKVRAI